MENKSKQEISTNGNSTLVNYPMEAISEHVIRAQHEEYEEEFIREVRWCNETNNPKHITLLTNQVGVSNSIREIVALVGSDIMRALREFAEGSTVQEIQLDYIEGGKLNTCTIKFISKEGLGIEQK